jgi:ribose 5-phosphate isomerase A
MQDRNSAKQAAAAAAAKLVQQDMVVGLGTGSTAALLIDALGTRVREEKLGFTAVATSEATERQARGLGIRIIPAQPHLDLAIDGADEVELGTLNLIKGLGGALLREKVVAQAAHRFVVIADDGKLVERLGMIAPLPIEVTRFGHGNVAARLTELGFRVVPRAKDGGEFITDNGNFILDCHDLPPQPPAQLDGAIKAIAGVVETGLFAGMAEQALIGFADGTVRVHEGHYPARAGVALEAVVLSRLMRPCFTSPPILLVMGVSGAGKTTIGALVAAVLGLPFQDADDLHPKANVEKMRRGEALNDADRLPWLQRVAAVAQGWRQAGEGGVIGCSALNRRYREIIAGEDKAIIVVHLDGGKSTINDRLATRRGHYMPPSLLDSQFNALEAPGPDENALIVSVTPSPMRIVMRIIQDLSTRLN